LSTDFINVASSGAGVIATVNLQTFMPAKDLATIDVSFSDDGSRLCIVYGDGSVSVVDRNVYLRENPQQRSWAFQHSADDGRETPSSIAASFEKRSHDFSISPYHSRSPSVLSNIDASEDEMTQSVSLAGLDRKAIRQQSDSTSAKCLPDVVPVWRQGIVSTGSCPVSSPKSAFFRIESSSSIDEEMPLSSSPSHSRVTSPLVFDTLQGFRRTSIPSADPHSSSVAPFQSLTHSKTCPLFLPQSSVTSATVQEKAACRYFRLPYWNNRAQCRKLVWTRSRLFVWLSVHNALDMEEHIVVLFSLSSEKVFSYRSDVEYML